MIGCAGGRGAVDIQARGCGNCRITTTPVARVWRVPLFDLVDTLSRDTFGVIAMADMALAARETSPPERR